MDTTPIQGLAGHVRRELVKHTPPTKIIEYLSAAGWPADEVKKIIAELQASGTINDDDDVAKLDKKNRDHSALRAFAWFLFFAIIGFLAIAYEIGGK